MKQLIRRAFNLAGFDIRRLSSSGWSYSFDYPIDPKPRWGYGRSSHPQMKRLLESQIGNYADLLTSFQSLKSKFSAIAQNASNPVQPSWNNVWFSGLDAAALMAFITFRAPRRYIEIGSGASTKFAREAITSNTLKTELISIDPKPRAEINRICDQVIRQPLEALDPQFFDTLNSDDILFFDGSHRTFTNSDVTAFFFDILPYVKRGGLVHIHDIFWPDDYPSEWNWRLYSEQYLLGAILFGGFMNFRVILPNYFVSHHPLTAPLVAELGILTTDPVNAFPGVSFWLEAA
jgi:hypothetical protein